MRTGYLTPSKFKDIMTKPKGYKSKAELKEEHFKAVHELTQKKEGTKIYRNLAAKIVELDNRYIHFDDCSRFGDTAKTYAKNVALGRFGITEPGFKSKYTDHGNTYESEARFYYEQKTGHSFPKENFRIISDEFPFIAGECDGQIYRTDHKKWGGEIKCPYNPLNHYINIEGGEQFKTIYKYQVAGYCRLYGWEGYTAVSYHPLFPEEAKLWFQDFERDISIEDELFNTLEIFEKKMVQPLVKEMENKFKIKANEMQR